MAHHERLEVWPPPLGQAVTDLPVVVHAMRRVELARLRGRSEAIIQSALEALDLVFTWLEVVARPDVK